MKNIALCAALLLSFGLAHAAKPCEELKSDITAKLDKKGVKGYVLEVVAADQVGGAKVVGSCDRGANKITYKKK